MMMAKVSAAVVSGKGLDTQLCIQHIFRFIDLSLAKGAQENQHKSSYPHSKKILAGFKSMTIAERTGGNLPQPEPHCELS